MLDSGSERTEPFNRLYMRQYSIYVLWHTTEDNIFYVGCTSHSIENRFKKHVKDALRGETKNTHKNNTIRKYIDNIGYRLIDVAPTFKEMLKLEIGWIAAYKEAGFKLTNMTDGGEGSLGRKHTEASKRLISIRTKAAMAKPETRKKFLDNFPDFSGENNPMYGRKHSKDTRNKLSIISKRKKKKK